MTNEQFSKLSTIPFTRPGAVPEIDNNGTQNQLLSKGMPVPAQRSLHKKLAQSFSKLESTWQPT